MVSKNVLISFPEELLKEYQRFCEEQGFKVSTRLQKLAEQDLKSFKTKCNTCQNSTDQQIAEDNTKKQE